MSGAWTCLFSFVHADPLVISPRSRTNRAQAAGYTEQGHERLQDIYDIAIAYEQYCVTGEPVQLGYVTVGGKDYRCMEPLLALSTPKPRTRPNPDPSQPPERIPPPSLERLRQNESIAPDPEH